VRPHAVLLNVLGRDCLRLEDTVRVLLTNDGGVDAEAGYISLAPLSFAVELSDLSPGLNCSSPA